MAFPDPGRPLDPGKTRDVLDTEILDVSEEIEPDSGAGPESEPSPEPIPEETPDPRPPDVPSEPGDDPAPDPVVDAPQETGADLGPPPDAGCTSGSCPSGTMCVDHVCVLCTTDAACGPDCLPCGPPLPHCVQGVCSACVLDAECGMAQYCLAGTCTPCGESDPKHCGPECVPCLGTKPACSAGKCVCAGDSCGKGKRCVDGTCLACDVDEACGPECSACAPPTPYCGAGPVCVQCLGDEACGQGELCVAGVCLPECSVGDSCETNLGPDGKTCGKAKIVGRKAAATGWTFEGDTSGGKNNDDQGTNKTECWDAKYDHFFRIWMRAGEKLDVTLTPKSSSFNSMLKLYQGTGCEAGGDPLIGCYNQGSDGKPDSIPGYSAVADGWYSFVVDGRMAFDSDQDYGPYALMVKLTCSRPDCCCP